MDISFDSSEVLTEHVHLVNWKLLLQALLSSNSIYSFQIFSFIELGDISGVKYVVDILKHLFIDDLGVHEQEGGHFAIHTSLHKNKLQVFSPVSHVVSFYDLNLV
jgi:hypothetical protein